MYIGYFGNDFPMQDFDDGDDDDRDDFEDDDMDEDDEDEEEEEFEIHAVDWRHKEYDWWIQTWTFPKK